MKLIYNIRTVTIGISLLTLFFPGCKKLIEVDLPIDKYTAESAYSSQGGATSAMNGIYIYLANQSGTMIYGTPRLASEISGELFPYRGNLTGNTQTMWTNTYRKVIYPLNSLIENVTVATGIGDNAKKILLSEAKFLRGLSYFYLVNLYGDVPLVLGTDFQVNSNIGRTPKEKVYDQVLTDLAEAQANLSDNYLQQDLTSVAIERVRPNKSAATALLARVYLYLGEWAKAEAEATKLIDNPLYSLPADLNTVFLASSPEAIWQLQPNPLNQGGRNTNTPEGRSYLSIYFKDRAASQFLLDAFEPGDQRKDDWLIYAMMSDGSSGYIPYKYKVGENPGSDPQPQTEYTMVLRLAEQYLIRAEARAHLQNITGTSSAESDVNVIRSRAGLDPLPEINDQEAMLDAIAHERVTELFTEGAHRWLDLKRTNKVYEVMPIVANSNGFEWNAHQALFPIPFDEFKYNPALRGHQNPGYPEQ